MYNIYPYKKTEICLKFTLTIQQIFSSNSNVFELFKLKKRGLEGLLDLILLLLI